MHIRASVHIVLCMCEFRWSGRATHIPLSLYLSLISIFISLLYLSYVQVVRPSTFHAQRLFGLVAFIHDASMWRYEHRGLRAAAVLHTIDESLDSSALGYTTMKANKGNSVVVDKVER